MNTKPTPPQPIQTIVRTVEIHDTFFQALYNNGCCKDNFYEENPMLPYFVGEYIIVYGKGNPSFALKVFVANTYFRVYESISRKSRYVSNGIVLIVEDV